MGNYHLSIHMAFWKESMINRLSSLINRNRSAAKMSQVLCSNYHPLPAAHWSALYNCSFRPAGFGLLYLKMFVCNRIVMQHQHHQLGPHVSDKKVSVCQDSSSLLPRSIGTPYIRLTSNIYVWSADLDQTLKPYTRHIFHQLYVEGYSHTWGF